MKAIRRGSPGGQAGPKKAIDIANEIGQTAGKIWTALVEGKKAMTVSQLKKKTKLPEDRLYMGIGWLAREDKLQFSGTSETTEVSLK